MKIPPVEATFGPQGKVTYSMVHSFHNRVEFGKILEGLRNFGGGGGVWNPQTPLGTPLPVTKFSAAWAPIFSELSQGLQPDFKLLA